MISFQGIFAQGFDQLLCCGIGGEVFSGGFLEMFAAQKYFIVITFLDPGYDFGIVGPNSRMSPKMRALGETGIVAKLSKATFMLLGFAL